jgi:hypothetical protein
MLVDDIILIRWVLAPTKEILPFTMSQGFHVVVAFLILALASLRSSSRCGEITDLQELHCKCTCLRVLDYQD